MKRKVLVIGRLTQLGPILNAQIIGTVKTCKLIYENEQVKFVATNISPEAIAREAKSFGTTDVLPIGIKGHMIPVYVSAIDKALRSEVTYHVVSSEGEVPGFAPGYAVKLYDKLADLEKQNFLKRKEAA